MVKDVAELPRRINEAFEIATSGRPGPVLVDLPKDVTAGILRRPIPKASTASSYPRYSNTARSAFSGEETEDLSSVLAQVAEKINMAKRPIIYAGQGILARPEGSVALRELAKRANIPVTTTLCALGAFDERDPKSLEMLGMHGSAYANLAMQHSDCILALGARFDDRVTGMLKLFAPEAKKAAEEGRGGIFHFEIVPKNINKVVQATKAVEGDVGENVIAMLPHIKFSERKEWFDTIANWKQKYPFYYDLPATDADPLKPQQVIDELDRQTSDIKEKVIVTTGVGQHQMWAAQHFKWTHPRQFITSGGLGTMGYGLPAAIGAKVGKPDHIVIDIDGDASFSMTVSILVRYLVHSLKLVLNNLYDR
jgi:acetolactate synthase-1/2/3 large subunit